MTSLEQNSFRTFATLASAFALLAALTIPSAGSGDVPAQADAFVNSIGVDSHFSYHSSPEYTQYSAQRDALVASGIRHIRDGAPTSDAEYLGKLQYFGEHGIIHTVGFPINSLLGQGAAVVTSTLAQQAPYVDAVEAGNEADQGNKPGWVEHVRAAQQILYDAVKSSPFTSTVTVLAPSLSGVLKSAPLLGPVPSDVANLHNATCNDRPTTQIRSVSFSNMRAALAYVSPGKPIWLTETGYDNDQASSCFLTTDAAARYVVTTVAERWNAGDQRIYFDTWSDQPQSRGFRFMGLVTASGSPKPQYTALKSMIALLSDRGPSFAPQPLDYALRAASPNVHTTLLEKRDGSYYLLLWLDVPSWDRRNFAPLPVAPVTVDISLPASIAHATSYRYAPDWSLQASQANIRGHSVSVPVSASMSFLELRP